MSVTGGSDIVRGAFIDLDGTIRRNNTNDEDGCYYCLDYSQVKWCDDAIEALQMLYKAGYKLFFVTMQNCIKEGFVSSQKVNDIIQQMADFLDMKFHVHITGWSICVSEEETDQSKVEAKVYAIHELAGRYGIRLDKSIGIGDRAHDIESYDIAGIGKYLQILNEFGDEIHSSFVEKPNYHISSNILYGVRDLFGCDIGLDEWTAEHYPLVEKCWGGEYILVNDEHGNYCSKILMINPQHKCSLHSHMNKRETFTILSGVLALEFSNSLEFYYVGESVTIPSGIHHRFWTPINMPCYFLETSTYHEDSDTYRLEESQ